MIVVQLIYRIIRKLYRLFASFISNYIAHFLLTANGIKYGKHAQFTGVPVIDKNKQGSCTIGDYLKMNSVVYANPIGRNMPCCLIIRPNAQLIIGNDVGMSSTAIICNKKITIGNHVKLGGNTVIYDTDFHSLDAEQRRNLNMDKENTRSAPVALHDNVFIGAHTTILKGVTIGENSIIGSCSVVTKDIPPNEIWAGNPAKFIKSIAKA